MILVRELILWLEAEYDFGSLVSTGCGWIWGRAFGRYISLWPSFWYFVTWKAWTKQFWSVMFFPYTALFCSVLVFSFVLFILRTSHTYTGLLSSWTKIKFSLLSFRYQIFHLNKVKGEWYRQVMSKLQFYCLKLQSSWNYGHVPNMYS